MANMKEELYNEGRRKLKTSASEFLKEERIGWGFGRIQQVVVGKFNHTNLLIGVDDEKEIIIIDADLKTEIHRFRNAHSSSITSVAIIPGLGCIVSGSVDRTIAMWDLTDKRLIHRFENAHTK